MLSLNLLKKSEVCQMVLKDSFYPLDDQAGTRGNSFRNGKSAK